ncbi:MAG TPA: dihydrodipicolinate synthase family protein [bacterium]|nr:dihydrodipicolinate synthase family protein [Candidatus Omnitrophota bacterium]HOL92915.1 dihydrodipicolinate synthase family protein [bacterium]HPP00236.1 dihydrodipicolinate synthase family protein [bacterium]
MAIKIEGIFTPHMVPLDDQGQIHEAELRRYVDWLIARGVHGLYPNGSTGEFIRFTPEERRRIIRIVCEQAGTRVPVLAGAAEANVRETLAACEAYAGWGARAAAIVSPFYYKLSPESVYAYFREIALHSPVDITLYNIPMFASPIDVSTLRRLAELERVVGIKDSSGDVAFMMRLIAAVRPIRPDFVFLTGWEAVLVPMLLIGCDGGTNATSGVVPELTRMVYELTKSGRVGEAVQLQYRLLELFDTMLYSADFPEGFRAAVELRGIRMGPSRQPLSPNQKIDRAALQRVLRCILADFGYVDPPPEGCPPRSGNLEEDRVAQITQHVIKALRERGVI